MAALGPPLLLLLATAGAGILVTGRAAEADFFNYPASGILLYGLSMTLIVTGRRLFRFSLPDAWFVLKPWEADGGLYRALGVPGFKWLLAKSGIELLNFSARLPPGRAGVLTLAQGVREAESDHVLALLAMAVINLYALSQHLWWPSAWCFVVNIIANVYPIMLQRMNRGRLAPLLVKMGNSVF